MDLWYAIDGKVQSVAAASDEIPFPTDPAAPPISVPPILAGARYKFPVPAGTYVKVKAGIYCEDSNVVRIAEVRQLTQNGQLGPQNLRLRYDKKDETGITETVEFPPLEAPFWITTEYAFQADLSVFSHNNDKSIWFFDQRFKGIDFPEGRFFLALSKDKAKLDLGWAPPF